MEQIGPHEVWDYHQVWLDCVGIKRSLGETVGWKLSTWPTLWVIERRQGGVQRRNWRIPHGIQTHQAAQHKKNNADFTPAFIFLQTLKMQSNSFLVWSSERWSLYGCGTHFHLYIYTIITGLCAMPWNHVGPGRLAEKILSREMFPLSSMDHFR